MGTVAETTRNEWKKDDENNKNKQVITHNQPIITEIGSRLQAQAAQVQSEHVIGRVMRTVNAQFRLEFFFLPLMRF